MLQIVALRGDYLYQIVHFCIINSTDFVVINILWW